MPAKILVIEDNPTNLDLIVTILKAFGHSVLEAHDGVEGLEIVRRERPDLILCDILMPEMSGNEVAQHLKNDPELRAIPLVAVTALAMVGDREKAIDAGFDAYLAKPLTPQRLMDIVNSILPAPKQ